jgi:hypothetical protein
VRSAAENEIRASPSAVSAFENVDGKSERLRNFFFAAECPHLFDCKPKDLVSTPDAVLVRAITFEFLCLAFSDLAEINDLVCHFTGTFPAWGEGYVPESSRRHNPNRSSKRLGRPALVAVNSGRPGSLAWTRLLLMTVEVRHRRPIFARHLSQTTSQNKPPS